MNCESRVPPPNCPGASDLSCSPYQENYLREPHSSCILTKHIIDMDACSMLASPASRC